MRGLVVFSVQLHSQDYIAEGGARGTQGLKERGCGRGFEVEP